MSGIPQRKLDYGKKLCELLGEYPTCLIVTVDNVGSSQIAELRKELRGRARFLFGKNTMIRKVIRNYIKETGRRELQALMDCVRGNSAFVFTKEDVGPLRKLILDKKVQSAARAGSVAPDDVSVSAGPTGMEPTQTSFFQAMNIPTRINRGQIDIVNDVRLIRKGEKVGASEASLLVKLGIKPFFYGMNVTSIYDDGTAYDAEILDITDNDMACAFFSGMSNVAALSFALNRPSIPQVPHSVLNGYKKCLALGLELENYTWEGLDNVKKVLENPDAFLAAPSAPTGGGGGSGGGGGGQDAPPPDDSSDSASSQGGPTLFDAGTSDSDSDSD